MEIAAFLPGLSILITFLIVFAISKVVSDYQDKKLRKEIDSVLREFGTLNTWTYEKRSAFSHVKISFIRNPDKVVEKGELK